MNELYRINDKVWQHVQKAITIPVYKSRSNMSDELGWDIPVRMKEQMRTFDGIRFSVATKITTVIHLSLTNGNDSGIYHS